MEIRVKLMILNIRPMDSKESRRCGLNGEGRDLRVLELLLFKYQKMRNGKERKRGKGDGKKRE